MDQENNYYKKEDDNDLPVNLSEGETLVIPVIQEKLFVENKTVESGRVQISKKVFEEESFIDTMVTSEEVVVERKEINQYVESAPPAVRQEGDVTIISVIKEVLVVEKRLMLVEELHVSKRKNQHSAVVSDTVRKEEISVTRTPSGTGF